jgi:phosphoribosylanthranilate isomerase
MSVIVKICGISTAETLAAALDAGADMIGFVFFEKSPRHVSLQTACALGALARGRAGLAALTVNADDEALAVIVAALDPDVLQLHGAETPERVAAIKARFGRSVMKAIGVADATDIVAAARYAAVADRILFDAKARPDARLPGGNGIAFDWRLLSGVAVGRPWMLSGGLDAANVAEAITLSGAPGVDVSSGVESAPGVKDAAKIAAFVKNARAAERRMRAPRELVRQRSVG